MKIQYLIYTITFLSFLGCEEMSLDPKVDDTYGDEATWKFPDLAEGVLMNAYAAIPDRFNSYSGNFLDVATDNAVTNNFSAGIFDAGSGGINVHSNPIGNWNRAFYQFRNINLFLENGLGENLIYNITDENADSLYRARLKGEAMFLRAWWGFQLLQEFGGKSNNGTALGYPIVTELPTKGEYTDIGDDVRNTYEECVEQIIADIDTAINYLPFRYRGNNPITGITGLGRADDQVAQALKSRVYLYAASPAYQDDAITKITGMGEFNVVDPAAYAEKWVEAALAAQEALNLIGNVPGLDVRQFNAAQTPNEFIWRRYHNDRNLESLNYPPLNYGRGFTSPSQNLVDAFPAQNGYPIDDVRSNYDPQNPYANRDPRLKLNVLHNGQNFLGDPLETFVGGKDSKDKHSLGTRTGYYLRKWMNIGDMLDPESPGSTHHYYALIRKTEMLLNFAEASNEAWGPTTVGPGCNLTAADAINIIRNNAGINSNAYITEVAGQGKAAFRRLIQNERRIELAFENQRYFDMRRWLLPLNETVTGVKITQNPDETLTFKEVEVEERKFDAIRYYYLPIPYNEQVKSADMVNNLGW